MQDKDKKKKSQKFSELPEGGNWIVDDVGPAPKPSPRPPLDDLELPIAPTSPESLAAKRRQIPMQSSGQSVSQALADLRAQSKIHYTPGLDDVTEWLGRMGHGAKETVLSPFTGGSGDYQPPRGRELARVIQSEGASDEEIIRAAEELSSLESNRLGSEPGEMRLRTEAMKRAMEARRNTEASRKSAEMALLDEMTGAEQSGQTPVPGQPNRPTAAKTPIEPYKSPYGRDRAEDFAGDLDQLRRANLEQEQPQAKQPSELDDIISDLEGRAQPKELDLVSKIAVALSGFSMDPRVPAGLRAQLEGRADTNRAQDQLMQAKLARARMESNERIAETKALAQGGEEDDELVNLNRDLTARKKDIELDPAYAPTRARVDLLRDKLRALGPTMDPEQLKALEAEYERQLMQLAAITQKRQRAPK